VCASVVGPSLEVITEEMTRLQKFSTVDIPQLIEILEKVRSSPYCAPPPPPSCISCVVDFFVCVQSVPVPVSVSISVSDFLSVLLITGVCLSFSLCVCLCVCALGVGAVGDEYDDLHNHDPKPQGGS
jgi:hypothetical protein